MTCELINGSVTMPDGSEVSYDALPNTNFRLLFPKAPWLLMFLQSFDMPGVNVNEVVRHTAYVDINEIGEKIIYAPFTCTFLLDKSLKNFKETFDWMKRMTAAGTSVGETDNVILIINGKEVIRFNDSWPTSLTGMNFVTNATDVQYLTATATFNYDYFEFV